MGKNGRHSKRSTRFDFFSVVAVFAASVFFLLRWSYIIHANLLPVLAAL